MKSGRNFFSLRNDRGCSVKPIRIAIEHDKYQFLVAYFNEVSEGNRKGIDRGIEFIKLSLLGTFGFFAAIFSGNETIMNSGYIAYLVYCPLIFNLIGTMLEIGISLANKKRGKILAEKEASFELNIWQNASSDENFFSRRPFTIVAHAYWTIIIIFSMVVPMLVTNKVAG